VTTIASPPPPARVDSSVRLGVLLAGGSLLGGLLAGQLVVSGNSAVVFGLAAVLLPVLLWKRPDFAPTVLLVGGLTVEQFPYTIGARAGAATAQIPLFHGTGGLHISPADALIALVFGIYVAKLGMGTVRPWPRSATTTTMLCLFGAILYGLVLGKIHGGQLRFAFTEVRPYVYLVATFLLTTVLVTTRAAFRAALWGIVIAVAFKAGQGLLLFMSVRQLAVRPDAVLGHEESMFFSLFILLTLALWLFDVKGTLRTAATWLVPLVLAGDLANTRRTAWLLLGVGVITLLAVSYAALPQRRRVAGRILMTLLVVSSVYLPAFWNKSGGLAQPARAVRSAVAPSSARDQLSDLYRIQEDENIWLNIREGGVIGKGFGVPINYALPIEDISDIDPLITYIPHNGVLYVLMRMGILGAVAFWSMLGVAILFACRLARAADREFAAVGALTVAIVVAYAFEGHTDQGFFFYRVAFVVGTLLGLAEAARRMLPPVVRAVRIEAAPTPNYGVER
jgi:O-Antigen ligase